MPAPPRPARPPAKVVGDQEDVVCPPMTVPPVPLLPDFVHHHSPVVVLGPTAAARLDELTCGGAAAARLDELTRGGAAAAIAV